MKFYLIRHGESEDNLKKITSRVDTKLSANGKAQVKTLRDEYKDISDKKVIVSNLLRAQETADLLGVNAYEIDERVREIDLGEFQGHSFDELEILYPEETKKRFEEPFTFKFPGGESFTDLRKRAEEFYEEKSKLDEDIVVISHEGFIKTILSIVIGKKEAYYNFKIENARICEIEIIDGFPIINKLNYGD